MVAHRAISLFLITMVFVLLPCHVRAATPVHGAKAAGMGTAFAAVADDPSAIVHNPAGLGFQKGTKLYAGVTGVVTNSSITDSFGQKEKTDFRVYYPPHLYVTSDLNTEKIVAGMGIFSPFGIGGRNWHEQGLTRYLSSESLIATLAANPTVAWRVYPSLSFACGMVYLWSYDRMEQRVDQSFVTAADGNSSFEADGDGWGYNLGLLWRATDSFNVAVAFRSAIIVDLKGKIQLENIAPPLQPLFGGSNFSTPASTDLKFPPIVTVGISWKPCHHWTLALETEWLGWSSFDRQTIYFEYPVPAAGFNDIVIDLNWKNSWIYKIGVEYLPNDNLALRFGYGYSLSPVPDTTLNPTNPDAPQHDFCLGLGYTINRLTVDLFCIYALYEDRNVSNTILSGRYTNRSYYSGISLGWLF
jgi:long-chain fatty acid transport protein